MLLPQGILDQRLNERDENWRLCYKALLLLEYLCKQGPYVSLINGHGNTMHASHELCLTPHRQDVAGNLHDQKVPRPVQGMHSSKSQSLLTVSSSQNITQHIFLDL